jgi:GTP-binding protein
MTLLGRAAVSYLVVLTKADLVKPPALARLDDELGGELRSTVGALPRAHATSSAKGTGIDTLRARLAMLAEQIGGEAS